MLAAGGGRDGAVIAVGEASQLDDDERVEFACDGVTLTMDADCLADLKAMLANVQFLPAQGQEEGRDA